MGVPSEVIITYDGTEIQDSVMVSGTSFESHFNAMPGSATIHVKDLDQSLSFVTGKEVTLSIDGVLLWGGYVTSVRRKFAFPAVDTVTRSPAQVKERLFVLSCVDYNILFDKRVIRQTTDYYHQLPTFTTEDFYGAKIRDALASSLYIDVPAGFDVSTEIDDVYAYRAFNTLTNGSITSGSTTVVVDDVTLEPALYPFFAVIKDDGITGGNREIVQVTGRASLTYTIVRAQKGTSAIAHGDNSFFMHYAESSYPQQGSPWRVLMQDAAQFGAVYYISPDKKVHFHAIEDVEARWGFSDVPNKNVVTASPVSYQGATYGFRDIDANQDGSPMVNDALIWGGSEWAGPGQTVFARRQNTDSINTHGRWQLAETHFGEQWFKLQAGVDVRAKVIVDGEPGAIVGEGLRGLRFPQWDISLGWFAKDVPLVSGSPDYLRAGQLVTIELQVFDSLEVVLPLRRLSISFPAKSSAVDEAWVKFEASFSLQLSDPYTIWHYLLGLAAKGRGRSIITTVDGANPAPHGALFSGTPVPDPDDTTTIFNLPDDRGYIGGTTEVYVEPGVLLRRGIDYTESNPEEGELTFVAAPAGGTWIWVVCRIT